MLDIETLENERKQNEIWLISLNRNAPCSELETWIIMNRLSTASKQVVNKTHKKCEFLFQQ